MTRDPVALGYVGLCIFLPMVLLVLPAGDLADRIDRRMMLIASYVVQVFASALLLLLTLSGVKAMWAFYSVITLLGVALGLSQPAMQSFLPFLVSSGKAAPGDRLECICLPRCGDRRAGIGRLSLRSRAGGELHHLPRALHVHARCHGDFAHPAPASPGRRQFDL